MLTLIQQELVFKKNIIVEISEKQAQIRKMIDRGAYFDKNLVNDIQRFCESGFIWK